MRGRLAPFAGLAGAVLALDQATKAWVLSAFALYESLPVVPGLFHLTYLRNPGAAFGLFSGRAAAFRVPFFLTVTTVALVVIGVVIRRLPADRRWTLCALALVFGGALGNLVDRLRWGEVVDFLDVFWKGHHWPAFNVADAAISVGMVMLIGEELLGKRVKRAA